MCGIAGCVIFNSVKNIDKIKIESTLESLKHRGPDDVGFILGTFDNIEERDTFNQDNKICLLHTRLSINDLSKNGKNPLTHMNSNVHVVFNGEIYNFKELKMSLTKKGYVFASNTDTEVLLVMYLEYGEQFVEMLDGMFAIAIWDFKLKKVMLFRDRIGIKPLYFSKSADGFYFASEIKALLKLSNLAARLDKVALAHYLQFQNQIDNRTLFQDVFLVEAGTSVIISDDEDIRFHKWWEARAIPENSWTLDSAKSEAMTLLSKSIASQLIADVTVSTYLSGGLDSTLITAIAKLNKTSLSSSTVGFSTNNVSANEEKFNEIEPAKKIASYLKIAHYSTVITPEVFIEKWVQSVISSEDLRVGPSVQVMVASENAKKKSVVVLSGAGGDELFGGYIWRYPIEEADPQIAFEKWFNEASRLLNEEQVSELMKDKSLSSNPEWNPRAKLKDTWNSLSADNSIDKALLMDLKIFLQGLLVIEDKLSMQNSIEVRVPMLSNAMIDFALSLPSSLKLSKSEGKIVLREIAKSILPAEYSIAIKQGFTPPLASWFQNELREVVEGFTLLNSEFLPTIFEMSKVAPIFEEHAKGLRNHRMLIWSLTSLEIWGQYFIFGYSEIKISENLRSHYRFSARS